MNAFTASALPSQLNNGNFIIRDYSFIANITIVAAVAVAVVAVVVLTGSCRIVLRSRVSMLHLAI